MTRPVTIGITIVGMEGPPTQRGSVRNVTFEGDSRTYFCEVRTLPHTGLRVGGRVWIEVGVKWAGQHKIDGYWRECLSDLPAPWP